MFGLKNRHQDSFFDDINGKKLDKYQKKAVMDNSDYLLVVAGAGSGKTLTIVGKVKYLIEKENYLEKDILCLSFTNETVNNLKEKINYNVDVFTFHKLALNILDEHHYLYKIAYDNLLNYVVYEYFMSVVNKDYLKEYFNNENENLFMQSEELKKVELLIISFIHKIKCNKIMVEDLRKITKKLNDKDKILMIFISEILMMYQEELIGTRQIDFDDMIYLATQIIEGKGLIKKYKYIIIDEYQDISKTRFDLISTILKNSDAKLMCVGDDYQAIYGFSGSNVSLFTDFFKYFKKASRIDIKNTYRNSYELIKISNRFIMKNPYQLRKNIHATFFYKHPVIFVYYDKDNYLKTYSYLLDYLYLENEKNIMVLGRYNKDLDEVKKIDYKGLNLHFLTVHMAKGLECDNVILLKMQNDYMGFPSKIVDYPLLQEIDDRKDEIPDAEERRLFYVALTRTKKRIYILVPRENPSPFLLEIAKEGVELLLKEE